MTKRDPAATVAALDAQIALLTAQREAAKTAAARMQALDQEMAVLSEKREYIRPLAETRWAPGVDWRAVSEAQAEFRCIEEHLRQLGQQHAAVASGAYLDDRTPQADQDHYWALKRAEEYVLFNVRPHGIPLSQKQTERVAELMVDGLDEAEAVARMEAEENGDYVNMAEPV